MKYQTSGFFNGMGKKNEQQSQRKKMITMHQGWQCGKEIWNMVPYKYH